MINNLNTALTEQTQNDIEYWRNILKRVVASIKSLASRGLSFRGYDEKFGSLHNGNYMMSLELIAEFDPLLSVHIKTYGNAGRGSVSYHSSTICDEFIELMAEELLEKILCEIKTAMYFSISTDSTPDILHIDQFTFIIRYQLTFIIRVQKRDS